MVYFVPNKLLPRLVAVYGVIIHDSGRFVSPPSQMEFICLTTTSWIISVRPCDPFLKISLA